MPASTSSQVLVQESDWATCQNAMEALDALGLTALVCPSTSSPLAVPPPSEIQLVILGLEHDNTDNLQRLQHFRHHFPTAVVMGLCPQIPPRERCVLLDSGLDFILEKPFTADECASSVRAILRRREMARTA